jgi:hypothetical protein
VPRDERELVRAGRAEIHVIASRPSDDIRDFLTFVGQAMGADAIAGRAGASPADIDAYAALVEWPLPALYRGYLQELGEGDGALRMADDSDGRLATLATFYREQEHSEVPEIPPNAVMIGVHGLSGELALLYRDDAGDPHGTASGEPLVVVCEYGETRYPYARTFRNHLYRQAFVRGLFRAGHHFSLRRNDPALLPDVRRTLEDLGFRACWFSDAYQVCLERDDAAVVHIARTPGRTSIYGCMEGLSTRDLLKRELVRQWALADSMPGT